MSPSGKRPDMVVADVVAWGERGGALPAEPSAGPTPRREAFRITDVDRDRWAFRPVRHPAVPGGPAGTDIDRFLHARL